MSFNPFNQTIMEEVRKAIAYALSRWRPDVSTAVGELPPTSLPVGGDTGGGFTPTAHEHEHDHDLDYATKESEYDARKIWGRPIDSTAPTQDDTLSWSEITDTWQIKRGAGSSTPPDPITIPPGTADTGGGSDIWFVASRDDNELFPEWHFVPPETYYYLPLPQFEGAYFEQVSDDTVRVMVSGRYHCTAMVAWQFGGATGGGNRLCAFGVGPFRMIAQMSPPIVEGDSPLNEYGNRTVQSVSGWLDLWEGQELHLIVWHDADDDLGIDRKFFNPSLKAHKYQSVTDLLIDDDGTLMIDDHGNTMIDA